MAEHMVKRLLFVRLLGAALGALFVYAGALKTLDPARFAVDIENYRLVSRSVAVLMALYLPWLEIVCGVALLAGRAMRGALWLITAMMLVFIGALVSAAMRGLDISCGCFGQSLQTHNLAIALARDLAMLAVSAGL